MFLKFYHLRVRIKEAAQLPVPEPGVDAPVQLNGDAAPPVPPTDEKAGENREEAEQGEGEM
jgi:hypothetical protein